MYIIVFLSWLPNVEYTRINSSKGSSKQVGVLPKMEMERECDDLENIKGPFLIENSKKTTDCMFFDKSWDIDSKPLKAVKWFWGNICC